MATVIAVANRKGGVGKSTTVCAFADLMRRQTHKRVLVIDCDSQCSSTDTLRAVVDEEDEKTIYQLMLDKNANPNDYILKTEFADIIPASMNMDDIETQARQRGLDVSVLSSIIERIEGYDYVFLDTPPGLGFMLYAAVYAADQILIPMRADRYSVKGFTQMLEFIYYIHDNYNPRLKVNGVLLTQYDRRTRAHNAIYNVIKRYAESEGAVLFRKTIRNSIAITDAQVEQMPITLYCKPESNKGENVAMDYVHAYNEFLLRLWRLEVGEDE